MLFSVKRNGERVEIREGSIALMGFVMSLYGECVRTVDEEEERSSY